MGPNYYVTPSPGSNGLSKKMLYLIVGLVVAVIIGAVLLLGTGSGGDTGSSPQRLLLRMNDLYTYTSNKKYIRLLKDDNLSAANTELSLSIGTTLNTIRPILEEQITTNNAQVVADEKDTSSIKKLESAKINNKLDREFRDILILKIKNTRALIVDSYSSLKSVKVKSAIKKANETLKTYQDKLEKINL